MNRREFITATVGLAAPAILGFPYVARAAKSDFAEQRAQGKLGVALLGLGGFSSATIAPELPFAKNVYFAGVVTGNPQTKGKSFAQQYKFPEKNIYTYEQIPQLADNPDIDIVHVVTPNGLHLAHTVAALKAGKHVICEKPMATNSADCQAMIDAAHQAGRYLAIDYRLHFEPHHLEMMRLASARVYGNVKRIVSEFSWARGNSKPWLLDKSLAGGGAMFDTGVYSVQAGCYIAGSNPTAVTASPSTVDAGYPPGIEEVMQVTFEYPGAITHEGTASYREFKEVFTVEAEKGTFACVKSAFSQSSGGKPSVKKLLLPDGSYFEAPNPLQLAVFHDRFAEAIRSKKPFRCPGEMGLRDIKIMEAIYRSVANGNVRTLV
jgi:predicted dehydrogenase